MLDTIEKDLLNAAKEMVNNYNHDTLIDFAYEIDLLDLYYDDMDEECCLSKQYCRKLAKDIIYCHSTNDKQKAIKLMKSLIKKLEKNQ